MDNGALVRRRPRYDRIILKQSPLKEGLCFLCHIRPFFYVMFGLEPDISFTDSRVKHGNDRGEEKRPTMTILFSLMLDF